MNNATYNIYSIRTYNNDDLIFYNSTKRKKISDILSSYKTRYKRFQNNKDNWLNVFYLLEQDKTYIRIEEQLTNSNDEIVKSRLCEYIAKNDCINKMNVDEIKKICNKETEKENQIVLYEKPKEEIKLIEEPKKEPKKELIKTINEFKKDEEIKLIEEPKKEIKEEIIKTINELKKDKQIKLIEEPKLTKIYDDDYLYNDENFEPPKDDKTIIKKLEDIKNIKSSSSSYKSKSSTSSVSSTSSTSSNNDYISNIKKTKTMKNLKDKNKKNRTLKNGE